MLYEDVMAMDRIVFDENDLKEDDSIKNLENITCNDLLDKLLYIADYRVLNNVVCESDFRHEGVKNTDFTVFNYFSNDLFVLNVFRKNITGFYDCYDVEFRGFRNKIYKVKNLTLDRLVNNVVKIVNVSDFLLREGLLFFYKSVGLDESNVHLVFMVDNLKEYLEKNVFSNFLIFNHNSGIDVYKYITTSQCARYLYNTNNKFRAIVNRAIISKSILFVVLMNILNKRMLSSIVCEKEARVKEKERLSVANRGKRMSGGKKDIIIDGIRYVYKNKNVNKDVVGRTYNRVMESWNVRGHMRTYKNGKTVYIKPFVKGKGKLENKKYVIK